LREALCELGFSIPLGAATYWVGEALGKTNYIDLPKPLSEVAEWTPLLTANAAHLATLLKKSNDPGPKERELVRVAPFGFPAACIALRHCLEPHMLLPVI
jgi:hypothetical protein